MRLSLPNVDQINESNVVSSVKQIVKALETEADLYGYHDTVLYEEIRKLREENNTGFKYLKIGQELANERLNNVDQRLLSVDQRLLSVDQRLLSLEGKVVNLETQQKETNQQLNQTNQRLEHLESSQEQMVELLRMIAHNTKKD
ncbi:hypothetical protein WDW89_21360 [Deltaproteobacteria bacterium TL4]